MLKAVAIAQKVPAWAYWLAAAGVALYIIKKGGIQGAAAGVVAGTVKGAVDVVIGGATGIVLGAGDVLGIPRTDESLCRQALTAQSTIASRFAATKYCTLKQLSMFQYLTAKKAITRRDFSINEVFGITRTGGIK